METVVKSEKENAPLWSIQKIGCNVCQKQKEERNYVDKNQPDKEVIPGEKKKSNNSILWIILILVALILVAIFMRKGGKKSRR